MKRLIVNADDFGADEARSAGIVEAVLRGSVTSVSILANTPAWETGMRALGTLSSPPVSWGVHLNLSEGRPLSSGGSLLIGPDGCFLGKARTQTLLLHPGPPELEDEIEREFEAQIRAVQGAGVTISHLDGHQHIHLFPAALMVALRVAERYHIPWFRIPDEPAPPMASAAAERLIDEAELFNRLARAARVHLQGRDVQTTDHFRGLYLIGRVNPETVQETLRQLPPGLTELMVHPGRVSQGSIPTPFSSFSHGEREIELEALLADSFRLALHRDGIELTPFPSLQGQAV